MTDYVTPTTWEQCARHVEAGGVVEVFDGFDEWLDEGVGPSDFRSRSRRPGDGRWDAPRRLVPPKWRRCADPAELAAAVAELGRKQVQVELPGEGWESTGSQTADSFAASLRAGCRYRLPVSWSWSPEPPAPVTGDDLRERIARAIYADDVENERTDFREGVAPCYYDNADAVLAVLPTPAAPVPPWPGDENDDTARLSPDQGDRIVNACCRMLGCEPADIDGDAALEEILTEAVERCADLHGQDRWEDDCHGCGFRVGDHTTDGRCPAPAAPVPPWPGAVLSGLTDEDGVPTWLAQAGQVRGEQVRRRSDLVWVDNDQMVAFPDTVWVEVRAPRAVPEPETERVQLGVAVVGGLLAICREGGTLDLGRGDVRIHTGNGALVASTSESMFTVEIDPDGTIEVLKDGDR